MRIKLTGYFKFSPIKESCVKAPTTALGKAMIRHAAGFNEYLYGKRDRDFYNAVIGACAAMGWYKTGGWMPNGRFSVKCREKNKGDILGICATFGEYSTTRAWLYCDEKFEEEMSKDFMKAEDVIRDPFSVRNRLLEMKCIPDQKWLDAFCERTHSPDAFARRQQYSREDAAKLAARRPEMAEYIKLMWRI